MSTVEAVGLLAVSPVTAAAGYTAVTDIQNVSESADVRPVHVIPSELVITLYAPP